MNEIRKKGVEDIAVVESSMPVKFGVSPDMPNISDKLMEIADEARENSYSPYSNYSVGAALLCSDGSIYTGCNVETVALIGTCAEKNALFKAISEGKRSFLAIAVSGGAHNEKPGNCTPCGSCRQVLAEFSKDNDIAIIMRVEGKVRTLPLSELLPFTFEL